MNKAPVAMLSVVIGLIATAAPILVALRLAQVQGLAAEQDLALSYARDVLRRTDETTDQITSATETLSAARPSEECSATNLATMRDIDIRSSYIQAVGRIEGDSIVCSSLGNGDVTLPLGPVDVTSPDGPTVRSNVTFAFAPKMQFVVVTNKGYAAIIHKTLPIDATTSEEDVALGVFSRVNNAFITARGPVKTDWIARLGEQSEATLTDDGYVVAVVRSARYRTGAVAAVPTTYLDKRIRAFAFWLVPVGFAAGLMLALAVVSLARQQLAMPAVLKSALRRNEFFVVYQPIVDLSTGAWVGAEALVRWRRSNGEMVRPDLFIPVAEDSGLINRITARVVSIVESEVGDLFEKHPGFHLALNLSAADLHLPPTLAMLRELARRTGARARNLMVEATERGFVKADTARHMLDELRTCGIQVAIDDFGTGYSSLSYLQTLKVDVLKIDRSFVDTIGTDAATSQVILHIIEMAKALNLTMVAEGVETDAQAAFLRERGVQFAQGWLFARPMSLADLRRGLAAA